MDFNMDYKEDGSLRQIREESAGASEEILSTARRIARQQAAKEKDRLNLKEQDEELYDRLFVAVSKEIQQLRVIFESVEAKEKERVWMKNQTHGDLDDNRLVDGATGEKTVFKRRGENQPLFGRIQKFPKRLLFVLDVSSSMSRFNGADRRLDRMAATAVMIMEALQGMSHKYDYSVVGHSGETHNLELVRFGAPPRNRKEKWEVIDRIYSHAQYCSSGDNTLASTIWAVADVRRQHGDDYFVFVLSDANIAGYGVSPKTLASALMADKKVNSFVILLTGDAAAESIKQQLPPGRAHLVTDTRRIPLIFKNFFKTLSHL